MCSMKNVLSNLNQKINYIVRRIPEAKSGTLDNASTVTFKN